MTMKAAAPGQEIYVTSTAIGHLRDRVDDELKVALSFVRSLVGTVGVEAPGFGVLGEMVLGGTYDGMCRWADSTLGEAEKTIDSWSGALTQGERNWHTAEKASAVRYRK
ncbi:hypothetical protein AB0H88_32085 [Nonomuraea sp. NPDC050680]|uniref:hypothetical protein n=1 Tax=Nonomuraea sp. NPDC050680 TaxID=3154630 RepID=UPI0033E490B5